MYEKLFSLQGRTALITGGSKGIGKAIARAFAEAGADIAICSRHENELAAAAQEIAQGLSIQVKTTVADLTKRDDAEKLGQWAIKTMGKIDILVAIRRPAAARLADYVLLALAAVDRLQPAGHRRRPQSGRRLLGRHPDGVEEGGRQQAVGDVVAPGQADPQPVVHARRVDGEELLAAAVDGAHVLDPPVGVAAGRAHGDGALGAGGDGAATVVVDADHGNVCVR